MGPRGMPDMERSKNPGGYWAVIGVMTAFGAIAAFALISQLGL
ncbi:MAG: hypothetical protein JWP35_1088 [Caulobacter sp.]|nr:hypothetical protein [Caulobacter sp.]